MNLRDSWDRLYSSDDRPWKGDADFRLPGQGTLLELGVGNGKGLTVLSAEARPIGLDFSRQALLSCRRWHSLPLVQGDATALPFKEGCFEFVSASHVLGHLLLKDRIEAASEMLRVLADDGGIYINVFGEQDMRCGKGPEVEERTYERGNGIICHYFMEDEVETLFSRSNVERVWERRVTKRFHGKDEIRQERRLLLRK
jgi:ubiquinone/menaquinone biosynthesis C-methylase UbiE